MSRRDRAGNRPQRYTWRKRVCKRLSHASALPERHLRTSPRKPAVDRLRSHRYNRRMQYRIALLFVICATLAGPAVIPAHAGDVSPEVWLGGGVSWPDYHGISETLGRGGIGA